MRSKLDGSALERNPPDKNYQTWIQYYNTTKRYAVNVAWQKNKGLMCGQRIFFLSSTSYFQESLVPVDRDYYRAKFIAIACVVVL